MTRYSCEDQTRCGIEIGLTVLQSVRESNQLLMSSLHPSKEENNTGLLKEINGTIINTEMLLTRFSHECSLDFFFSYFNVSI